jgi:hypothetical protein
MERLILDYRQPKNRMIRFGRARQFSDVTLEDHIKYPIWTSAHDDRHDEESEKPIVNSAEVTQVIIGHPLIVPIITLKIRNTELLGTGWYLHRERKLFAISVWHEGRWKSLGDVGYLIPPIMFVSVPKILGEENVEFLCSDLQHEQAFRIG